MRCRLRGLDCPDCAAKLERELRQVMGLEEVAVHFNTLTLEFPDHLMQTVQNNLARLEPEIRLEAHCGRGAEWENIEEQRPLVNIVIAGGLFFGGLLLNDSLRRTPYHWAEYTVFLTSYLLMGWPVIRHAFRRLLRRDWLDENFLMTLASWGAIALDQVPEAAGVMFFYAVGEYLQSRAVNRSRRSIAALLNVQPEYANLNVNGELQRIPPDRVDVGAVVWVKPGEKVPLDGKVLEGSSYLDTSALTGEAVPRKAEPGATVLAGMINGSGLLTVEVVKPYHQSSIARIIHLVEQASERKAPTEQFITVFSRYYTPAVVGASVLVALLPPLLIPGARFGDWLTRALVLLVISCPCALMVSIPLGYFGGIGGASRKGILIKGANYLDALARVDTAVFDKTGTLTKGVFRVTRLEPCNGFTPETLLAAAAGAEAMSNHPIADSIRHAWLERGGSPIGASEVRDYQEIAAHGICATVKGSRVLAGNRRLLLREGITHQDCDVEGTSVYVAVDGVYAGYILISDELKEDAATAIQQLRRLGVRQTVMLTGDEADTAKRVAETLGLDAYYAGLLPEDKVARLEELEQGIAERKRRKLVFVGDGINDAPVISRADIGVAMGGLGSDAAIEAADVVLMEDAPGKLATAIEIARRTKQIVWQNIVFALGVKGFFIMMGTFGMAGIWEAVFADVGVTLLAVLNASRTLRNKRK